MESAVCRVLLALFLYTSGISPAPQDTSAITYVRPLSEESPETPGVPSLPMARESRVENLPLVIGGLSEESKEEDDNDSQADISTASSIQRSTREETTVNYEPETAATERSSEEVAAPTEANKPKPRFPSPRFVSKLSYFQKSNDFGSAITNLVERTGKRKFRSRCRCEKIWNCPKLQITVPRCPEEYFMCCF